MTQSTLTRSPAPDTATPSVAVDRSSSTGPSVRLRTARTLALAATFGAVVIGLGSAALDQDTDERTDEQTVTRQVVSRGVIPRETLSDTTDDAEDRGTVTRRLVTRGLIPRAALDLPDAD